MVRWLSKMAIDIFDEYEQHWMMHGPKVVVPFCVFLFSLHFFWIVIVAVAAAVVIAVDYSYGYVVFSFLMYILLTFGLRLLMLLYVLFCLFLHTNTFSPSLSRNLNLALSSAHSHGPFFSAVVVAFQTSMLECLWLSIVTNRNSFGKQMNRNKNRVNKMWLFEIKLDFARGARFTCSRESRIQFSTLTIWIFINFHQFELRTMNNKNFNEFNFSVCVLTKNNNKKMKHWKIQSKQCLLYSFFLLQVLCQTNSLKFTTRSVR